MNQHLKEFFSDTRPVFIGLVFLAEIAVVWYTGYSNWLWLAFVAGLFFFFVIEYFIHRFILHGLMKAVLHKAYEGHVRHHMTPTEMKYLLTPNVYNLPGYVAIWIAGWLLTKNPSLIAALVAGISLSQLNYEWTHFVSHRPIVPRTSWGRWMKKFHLLHHYKNEHYWFGVTHPAMDVLLRTDPEQKSVATISPPTEVPVRKPRSARVPHSR